MNITIRERKGEKWRERKDPAYVGKTKSKLPATMNFNLIHLHLHGIFHFGSFSECLFNQQHKKHMQIKHTTRII